MERTRANVLLWVGQVVLAIMFLVQGVFKFWQPSGLPDQLSWVYDITGPMAVFLGIAELAAVAGLLLPGITGILPILTPVAALGLVPIMAGATVFHLSRGELTSAVMSAVVGLIAAGVAYGRWRVAPLSARVA